VLAALLAAVALLAVAQRVSGDTIVRRFAHWRLVERPLEAVKYGALGLVYPAVGPAPRVRTVEGHPALTYEPLNPRRYSWLTGLAAAVWCALLVRCGYGVFRAGDLQAIGWALGLWYAFNAGLHGVWGDELFFYSPHWSWAMMLTVLLGSRALAQPALLLAALAVAAGQAAALASILRVLPR
jgi:hypothetical protein